MKYYSNSTNTPTACNLKNFRLSFCFIHCRYNRYLSNLLRLCVKFKSPVQLVEVSVTVLLTGLIHTSTAVFVCQRPFKQYINRGLVINVHKEFAFLLVFVFVFILVSVLLLFLLLLVFILLITILIVLIHSPEQFRGPSCKSPSGD